MSNQKKQYTQLSEDGLNRMVEYQAKRQAKIDDDERRLKEWADILSEEKPVKRKKCKTKKDEVKRQANCQAKRQTKRQAERSLRLFLKDVDDHHKKLRNKQKQAKYRKKFIASLHPYKRKLYSNQRWDVTFEEVLAKFGENPKCYLTGDSIDIYDTKSYHFDHIIPISRYGSGRIENMQITTAEANYAKGCMLLEEFKILCAKVVSNKGNEV